MAYSNSPLVSYTLRSPNYSNGRWDINRIAIHCVVGQVTIERLGQIFANPARQASSNYGVSYDGKIGLFVDEKNRSWCTSSYIVDNQAITIEVASDSFDPYAVTDKALKATIDLCEDICRRNGKTRVTWIPDKETNKAYTPEADEMLLTVHRFYANKACCGDYLFQRHPYIRDELNKRLQAPTWGVDDYVGGLYKYALNREPDANGYKNWCGRLRWEGRTAAQVAWGFFGSKEYQKKQTTDERYVQQLYEALLRREPDKTGKRNRLKELEAGKTREAVCKYITDSREFKKFCERRELICR